MTITTRTGKGLELTWNELDENFTDLRDGINAQVPNTKGEGIRVGPYGDESYPWADLMGHLHIDADVLNSASRTQYRGGIYVAEFDENDSAFIDFHLPHDYLPNSNIFIHAHWSHNSLFVTGGSVTIGFELMYAKGHGQGVFPEPVVVNVSQNASTTQFRHMILEGLASTPGGAPSLLNTDDLEVDGILQCRVFLDSNDITVSEGLPPSIFIHTVDIHYQTTNVGTKNRSPDFWE